MTKTYRVAVAGGAVAIVVAVWAISGRLSPAVAVALAVGVAAAWAFLAWGPGRLPELTLGWFVAGVVLAYAFARLPDALHAPVAALVLVGPPVGYLLSGRASHRAVTGRRSLGAALVAAAPTAVAALLAAVPTATLVHVLGWGYDNAAHVANTSAFLRQGTFFFLDDTFRESTFSYYRTYPGGTYALWNLFASASGLDATHLSPPDLAALYATFLVGTTALFLAACYVLVLRAAARWSSAASATRAAPRQPVIPIAAGLAVLVIVLGSFGHLLWSGWPALLAGYATLLAFVAIALEGRRSPLPFLVSAAAGVVAVGYTYPLLLPFVGVAVGGAVVSDMSRAGWRDSVRWLADRWGLAALAAGVLLMYKPLIEVKRGGSGSVLVFGDIEPVGWAVAMVGGLLAVWLVVTAIRRRDWLVAVLIPLSALFAAGLCAYSLVSTSLVQYYPMRAVYTVLILVLLLATGAVAATGLRSGTVAVVGCAVLLAFVVTTMFVGVRPLLFAGPYMGSTVQAVEALRTQDLGADVFGCGRMIVEGAAAIDSGDAAVALVVPSTASAVDLPSRWANALAYRMNDTDRFLTMDLNTLAADPARFGQTIRGWRAAGGSGAIVVVAAADVVQALKDAGALPTGVDLVPSRCDD
jgi:hypothetical protein